jgi:pilus assembly protein CpaF
MSMFAESLRAFLKPVLPYIDDETVTEVMINGPTSVWIERKGRLYKTDARFTEEGLLGAARNMAQFVGRFISEEKPRLDARLPDGSRIHVVLPPIARQGATIAIRKFFKDRLKPDDLVNFGSITPPMVRLIEAVVRTKLNLVVSGGTGSGKTTLLNILSNLIPDDERILTIEDSAELQLNQDHLIAFESRPADKFGKGEVSMADLLKSALRLRPDRIILGEVRGGEAFDLMQAMNTGHGGSMSTVHANTPTDTLRRLEALCLMSSIEMPMVAVRAGVASAVNFVTCSERLADGSRKVIALSEVLPLNDKGDYRTQDIFLFVPVTKDEDGTILGYHAPTGILPTFLPKARAYGFDDLTEAFFDPATYGVPAPPLIHGLGENVTTHWAPSLKHRERGQPDPESVQQQWREFERRLKEQAKHKRFDGGSKPKPAAHPAPASKPLPRPMPARPAASNDNTPPPTRNPLLARRTEETSVDDSQNDTDEPSNSAVRLSDSMEDEQLEHADTSVRRPPPGATGRPGAPRPAGRPLVPPKPIPPKR